MSHLNLFHMTEFFLSHQFLYRYFQRIGNCNESFKTGLDGIGNPLGNNSRILAKFVGQLLIVQFMFWKNDSYTIKFCYDGIMLFNGKFTKKNPYKCRNF